MGRKKGTEHIEVRNWDLECRRKRKELAFSAPYPSAPLFSLPQKKSQLKSGNAVTFPHQPQRREAIFRVGKIDHRRRRCYGLTENGELTLHLSRSYSTAHDPKAGAHVCGSVPLSNYMQQGYIFSILKGYPGKCLIISACNKTTFFWYVRERGGGLGFQP